MTTQRNIVERLEQEAASHQTVYEDDRRRKELFDEAAAEITRLDRLNDDKHRTIQAYCKAASDDKAEIARLRGEIESVIEHLPSPCVIRIREGGGDENICATLAVSCRSLAQAFYNATEIAVQCKTANEKLRGELAAERACRDRLVEVTSDLIALFGTENCRSYSVFGDAIKAMAVAVTLGYSGPITLAHADDVHRAAAVLTPEARSNTPAIIRERIERKYGVKL